MKKTLATIIMCIGLAVLLCSCKSEIPNEYFFDETSEYKIGGGEVLTETVSEIDIGWISGKVTVKVDKSVEKITFSEEYDGKDSYKMRYTLENGTLKIRYARNGANITKEVSEKKNLTVLIPDGKILTELETETIGASCFIEGVSAVKMDLSSVSGRIECKNCSVGNVGYECETVSGAIVFRGKIDGYADMSSVSGNAELYAENVIRKTEWETTSGNLRIDLPSNAKGFKVDFSTVSGGFHSDKEYSKNNGIFKYGDESVYIDAKSVSGSIEIKMN